MAIKIQTREEVDDLDLMIDVFLAEHTGVKPDIVWMGEILYTHHRKLLGITFATKEQHKRVKLLGWKLEHIEGRAWILEDGGIAVQVGINGPDLSVPTGWLLTQDQDVLYVDRYGDIDSRYRKNLIEAIHAS